MGDGFVLLYLSYLFLGALDFFARVSVALNLLFVVWFSALIGVCDPAAVTLGLFQFYQPVNQLPVFHRNIK